MEEAVDGAKGEAQRRRGEFGLGWVEEALGFGDLLVDLFEQWAELVGDFGREGGDAGERGVDAVEEAGLEAGVVAVVGWVCRRGRGRRAVAVVADVEAATAAATGWATSAAAIWLRCRLRPSRPSSA